MNEKERFKMNLKELLLRLKEQEINKVFFFFQKKDGEIGNVIFQDGCFFTMLSKGEIKRFNPFIAYDAVLGVEYGNYKVLGFGQYGKSIDIKKLGGVA